MELTAQSVTYKKPKNSIIIDWHDFLCSCFLWGIRNSIYYNIAVGCYERHLEEIYGRAIYAVYEQCGSCMCMCCKKEEDEELLGKKCHLGNYRLGILQESCDVYMCIHFLWHCSRESRSDRNVSRLNTIEQCVYLGRICTCCNVTAMEHAGDMSKRRCLNVLWLHMSLSPSPAPMCTLYSLVLSSRRRVARGKVGKSISITWRESSIKRKEVAKEIYRALHLLVKDG